VDFRLYYKQLRRGSGLFNWVLKVPNDHLHSHQLAPFGLRYDIHRHRTTVHLSAVQLAKTHREAFLTYSQSVRILDQQGLSISREEYYRLKHLPTSNSAQGFEALIVALEDVGFVHRCRLEEQIDSSGTVVAAQLEQIWFALPGQVEFARRFISDFVGLVDGTFSTNRLNLVLIVVNGVTNTDKTFPACFSFARSESKLSFDFLFGCLKDLI
jgi:MULE transposase domain